MKVGDLISAAWPDGMICVGRYDREERGYIILIGEGSEQIVCNKSLVKFEVVQPTQKSDAYGAEDAEQ